MAEITESTPQQELDELLQNRRTLGIGLILAALGLGIFGFWIYAREQPAAMCVAAFVLCGVSFFVGLYHLFMRRAAETPESRIAKFRTDKKFFGLALAVGGVALLLFGVFAGFQQGLSALGEALGLCLFGLIVIGVGRQQLALAKTQSWRDRLLESLTTSRKPFSIGLVVAGAILVLVGLVWRGSVGRVEASKDKTPAALKPADKGADKEDEGQRLAAQKIAEAFPRWGGVMLLGIVCLAVGVWLNFAAEVNGRIAILVLGGSLGLAIAIMTLVQAWFWRDVFLGGLTRWRGEDSWKIWVCSYLELFGLALMFGSLLVVRPSIRVNPVLRRFLYGYNAIFTGLLLLAFLIVLNIVVYAAYPLTYDWSSSRGLYTISESTKDILERMKQPATLYVLVGGRFPFYKDLHNLLDNCQVITDKLKVQYISPDQDFQKYHILSQRYPEILPDVRIAAQDEVMGRGVLVVYGPEPSSPLDKKQAPHAFVPSRKLYESKPGRGTQTYSFVGEKVLITELLFLMEGQKKSKVYFLQGDEEMNVHERQGRPARNANVRLPMSSLGIGGLIRRLKEENYDVRGLSFAQGKDDDAIRYIQPDPKDKKKDIPADAGIVVIAGPSVALPRETLDALGRYMEKNGRLLVLLDVVVDDKYTRMIKTGLEDFLKKFNVDVTPDYLFRYPEHENDLPTLILATTPKETENLLAKKFPTPFFLESARVIRPLTTEKTYKAEPLFEARSLKIQLRGGTFGQTIFWAESNIRSLANPLEFAFRLSEGDVRAKMSREPIPVAVTVRDDQERPRLIVLGDAELASDLPILQGMLYNISVGEQYYNLMASSLDWLMQRPGVGARPKEAGIYFLDNTIPPSRLIFLPGWVLCILPLGLGLGMWLVRRR